MPEAVKLIGNEIAFSTANTFGGATCVRVYNNTASVATITRATVAAGNVASCQLHGGVTEYFLKGQTNSLISSAAIRAAAVAISH